MDISAKNVFQTKQNYEEKSSRSEKHSSKKKKKEKKSKKSKKHKKRSSSSSSRGSSGSEWIEKGSSDSKTDSCQNVAQPPSSQRDEWMTVSTLFPCVTRDQLRAAKEPSKKKLEEEEKKKILDCPGQSGRELNPYWANGGTGLPPEAPGKSIKTPGTSQSVPVTVGKSDWYKKALRRAKEQAEEEGRPLEEVAAERWGSLEKLLSLISEAEKQSSSNAYGDSRRAYDQKRFDRPERRYDREDRKYDKEDRKYDREDRKYDREDRQSDRKYDREERKYDRDDKRNDRRENRHDRDGIPHENQRNFDRDRRSSPIRFRRPGSDDDARDRRSNRNSDDFPAPSRPRFQKPDDSGVPTLSTSYRKAGVSSGNWRKKDASKATEEQPTETKSPVREKPKKPSPSPLASSSSESESESDTEKKEVPQVLTDVQLNDLAARLVKAEILGNDSLAADLKQKLESAREARKAQPEAAAAADKKNSLQEEVVVLTRTDSKGFSRPLETTGAYAEPYGGRRRKQKTTTHSADGKRERYFPDDDKYSLKEMFQKEKSTTVEDDREMFVRLAGKGKLQDHDLDMDDIFAERARESASDGKLEARDRDRAIREHKRLSKVLDNCQWCFDTKSSLRHLVVSVGSVSYVCLPAHQSLTDGHCLIAPIRHVTCATQLDEDVWQEMQDFRKALVKMFEDRGDDCIFFESAMYLQRQPHMVLNCVPLPRKSGETDLAQFYFKKAIQECETEWSSNKKLVDLKGRDIRKAVPKGLPYFAVDFGMDNGFAHVIEDEKMFSTNFAQEIIGGMLELDHFIWRKPRRESFEVSMKKVNAFIKEWSSYDITKKGKKRKKEQKESKEKSRGHSSSSSSDSD